MGDAPGRFLAGQEAPDEVHGLPGQGGGILPAGGQVRPDQPGDGGGVKAGDDHVLGNAETVLLQGVANGDGHGVVGAEDCPGEFLPVADQLAHDLAGRRGPVVAVGHLGFAEGQAQLLQHLPVAAEAVFGVRLVLHAGHEEGIPGPVVHDDVAEQGFEALFIIVDDRPAARQLRAGTDHRDMMLLGALYDFGDQLVVMDRVIDDQDGGEQVVLDRLVDRAGGVVVLFVPEEIQRRVEERDAKALGGSNPAQGMDEPGVRETVGLGQAHADQLRLFGHRGILRSFPCGIAVYISLWQAKYSTEAGKMQRTHGFLSVLNDCS